MSNSVNTKFAKCFIIFMATVILVQGVVYVGLATWGIQMHNCKGENSDPMGKPFEFVLNLIYFSSEECEEPVLHAPGVNEELPLKIDFKKAQVISDREYIFQISYIVISILWIVTSLLVLVTICCPLTKVIALVCFWPWLSSVILGSILDVIATGFHIKDIFKTLSAESTFQYVGVTNTDQAFEYFKKYIQNYDVVFMIPALIFSLITSRIVLIWFLNIVGVIFCISLAKVLSSNHAEKTRQPRRPSSADTAIPTNFNQEMQQNQEEEDVVRFRPPAPSQDTVRKVRSSLEPVKTPPIQTPPPSESYALPISREASTKKNIRASNPAEASTYQISDAHPENLDYPPNRYSAPTSEARSVTPQLSAISPLNLRYSTIEGGTLFPNQTPVAQELRGQLPWSYTNIMNDPIAQKRIQAHLKTDDEEDVPPIPVPDYTLHPPRKERTPVGQERLSHTGYSRW